MRLFATAQWKRSKVSLNNPPRQIHQRWALTNNLFSRSSVPCGPRRLQNIEQILKAPRAVTSTCLDVPFNMISSQSILIEDDVQALFLKSIQMSQMPSLGAGCAWYPFSFLIGFLMRRAFFLWDKARPVCGKVTRRLIACTTLLSSCRTAQITWEDNAHQQIFLGINIVRHLESPSLEQLCPEHNLEYLQLFIGIQSCCCQKSWHTVEQLSQAPHIDWNMLKRLFCAGDDWSAENCRSLIKEALSYCGAEHASRVLAQYR